MLFVGRPSDLDSAALASSTHAAVDELLGGGPPRSRGGLLRFAFVNRNSVAVGIRNQRKGADRRVKIV